MASSSKDYFGLDGIVSIILAIFAPTAYLLGAVTRIKEGKIVAGIIRLLGVGAILWIVDLVLIILNGRILRLLDL